MSCQCGRSDLWKTQICYTLHTTDNNPYTTKKEGKLVSGGLRLPLIFLLCQGLNLLCYFTALLFLFLLFLFTQKFILRKNKVLSGAERLHGNSYAIKTNKKLFTAYQLLLQIDGPYNSIVTYSQNEEEEEAQLSITHLPNTSIIEDRLSPIWQPINQDVIISVDVVQLPVRMYYV